VGPFSGDNGDSMKVGAEMEAPSMVCSFIFASQNLNLVFLKKKLISHARLPLKSSQRKVGSVKRCTHHLHVMANLKRSLMLPKQEKIMSWASSGRTAMLSILKKVYNMSKQHSMHLFKDQVMHIKRWMQRAHSLEYNYTARAAADLPTAPPSFPHLSSFTTHPLVGSSPVTHQCLCIMNIIYNDTFTTMLIL